MLWGSVFVQDQPQICTTLIWRTLCWTRSWTFCFCSVLLLCCLSPPNQPVITNPWWELLVAISFDCGCHSDCQSVPWNLFHGCSISSHKCLQDMARGPPWPIMCHRCCSRWTHRKLAPPHKQCRSCRSPDWPCFFDATNKCNSLSWTWKAIVWKAGLLTGVCSDTFIVSLYCYLFR